MGAAEACLIMFGGFGVLVLLRVPVAFALGLSCLPMLVLDDRLNSFILVDRTFQSYNSFLLLAVPFFLLAANIMNGAGITDRLVRLSKAMVGHLPGGLGHINVLVSMLFAGVSGSSTADAAGVGKLMIPAMINEGFDRKFSIAITACSSVMGAIIPPSILMVVWGGVMSVSVGALFLAGAVPGVMIALVMMLTVYFYARVRDYPVHERSNFRNFIAALGSSILALFTPLLIVGGIAGGFFTPTESSVVAVLYSAAIGMLVYRSVGLRKMASIVYDSARFASLSLFCIGTASAFGWLLAYYQVPKALVGIVQSLELSAIGFGFAAAMVFLVIGLFIDAVPAIIILGTLLHPVALSVGMHPVHFAVIGIISLSFGLVTPPYGLCLLIASAIGGLNVKDVLKDVTIILVPMLIILSLVIVFSQISTALPQSVMPKFM